MVFQLGPTAIAVSLASTQLSLSQVHPMAVNPAISLAQLVEIMEIASVAKTMPLKIQYQVDALFPLTIPFMTQCSRTK